MIGSLHIFTEERTPTVYEALSRWVDPDGEAWLRIRVPLVRDARLRGWVPQSSLGPLHTDHTQLRIDTTALRATLYDNGKVVWSAPVGIGKPGTTTPHGQLTHRCVDIRPTAKNTPNATEAKIARTAAFSVPSRPSHR